MDAELTQDSINVSALESLQAVLDHEFPALVAQFRRAATESLLKLSAALSQNDRVALRAVAHNFKGAALNLYANQLAAQCAKLEVQSRAQSFDILETLVNQVHVETNHVLIALDEWLDD